MKQQREARLEGMCTCQREQLAIKTSKERDIRLETDSLGKDIVSYIASEVLKYLIMYFLAAVRSWYVLHAFTSKSVKLSQMLLPITSSVAVVMRRKYP